MLKYIILGIIQGITEFFPVSSSGHLVIFQKILGITGQELVLTLVLHLGTALALIVFFFKDILGLLRNPKWVFLVIIVTAMTGAVYILGNDFFEKVFSSARAVAVGLGVTGVILLFTKSYELNRRGNINLKDAFILGIMQGVAIIPGISRSGITISTLLFRKIDRQTSFRFSFLASIPAVLGAAILKAKDIGGIYKTNFFNISAGLIFSFLCGILSLWILKKILLKAKLYYFGYYCLLLAVLTFLFVK